MNPLTSIPAHVRVALYWTGYVITTLTDITTAAWVAVAAASPNVAQPVWLIVGTLVLHLVANHLNLLAGSNVPSFQDVVEGEVPVPTVSGEHRRDDRGASLLRTCLAVLVIAVIVGLCFGFGGRARAATPVQPARPYWADRTCPAEDSVNCFWDAEQRGDGGGHSFIKRAVPDSNGLVCRFFTELEYAKTHDVCSR